MFTQKPSTNTKKSSLFIGKSLPFFSVFLLLVIIVSPNGTTQEVLTDEQLQFITAGSIQPQILSLSEEQTTHSGTKIWVEGDIYTGNVSHSSQQNLTLTGNAQQNLNSLININAVNSPVNVLLNLNITVDSMVESIQQANSQTLSPLLK